MTYILLYLIYITILVLSGCGPTEVESNRVSVKLPEPLQAALEKADSDRTFLDTDMAIGIRGQKIAEIINSINSIAENNRRIMLQLSTEHRKLAQEPNYYVELYDLPNNVAIGTLRNLTTAWSEQGALEINSALGVDGTIKLHGHYNPLAVGGHIGFRLNAEGTLRGKIVFTADPQELLAVSFQLLPSRVSYSIKTSVKDKKEWCWQMDLPFGGEAKDCKTLWQYEIPISFSYEQAIPSTDMIRLPVRLNLPSEFHIQKQIGDVQFNRKVNFNIVQNEFTSDAQGIFLKAKVRIITAM